MNKYLKIFLQYFIVLAIINYAIAMFRKDLVDVLIYALKYSVVFVIAIFIFDWAKVKLNQK
ncbi:hypothetical protein [Ornithobacterium rhinotracheale]|uniref:Uncharacterized protein n=1 Tax=Ornithobacterium rhinotracheale (strain ATCC 51463 / DSM 15997 / CCUG 23171 / CIP 104009 / LMG 9086) TaxID=867902 RepID=I3ZYL5_ORNRL|nr:hypothetical protein [Ornithobacterium rhinotracheale]AFL96799.1 hypothetical protein Ornrh_0598 [Ornithobacterium rhinotracheale DSM 15997]AIQ00550.1 hypothetical protein Q785_06750 [Ornithobacterium rhinotracheale ORT-UMN 88]KGB66672.1 hypothetical protein Q787_06565 [Ornithobacterium rhinotracheale H06-030791]MCK0194147.1 hypothetical protein [Ornithobacterium rhinotracheale]MCK0199652.1 hypothetical protein [Ornithobacterium rhinotracheale]